MKNSNKVPIILFGLGLLLILIPRFILPVCEYTGKPSMKCSSVAHYEMALGAAILLISGALYWLKKTGVQLGILLACTVAGIAVIWIPEYMGYCKSPNMPCNYGTVPALRLLGGALVLFSFISLLFTIRRHRQNKNDLI
jgi:hypothetical protein